MKVIGLFLILFFPCMGFAEGPPVTSDGKVFVDHLVFELTDAQLAQVEVSRLVEFTPSQLNYLKKLNSAVPNVIPVVAPTYNNCTCDLLFYGIWYNQKQIAIPLLLFNDESGIKYHQSFDKQMAGWASDFFVIDTQANVYWQGKKIAKEDVIQIAKQTESDTAFIDLPLMKSAEVKSRVNRLLKFIVKEGKKSQVRVSY